MADADETAGLGAVGRSENPPPVRVFISYAHESEAHAEAVRDLWVLLRRFGVDARLDRPAAEQRQDWPLWMIEQVREADFVLVVVSPAYRRRAEGQAGADEGRGVQFEAALIREALYAQRAITLERVLPVVLPGMSTADIPVFLQPTAATSYPVGAFTLAGVERLLRVLTGQPGETEPPVGQVPPLGVRAPVLSSETGGARVAGLVRPVRQDLTVEVTVTERQLRCRTVLAGTVLGERSGPVPVGMDRVWDGLGGVPLVVEAGLAEAGRRLCAALFDPETLGRIVDLADHSPWGSTVELVVAADGAAAGWPFELLRLPDGRVLATLPAVRLRRRLPGGGPAGQAGQAGTVGPLPGPLKILVAVAAPAETRTASPPLDGEAEMQAVLDAVGPLAGVDSAAQVRILEVAGLVQIEQALRADQYHVLHLSAHGSAESVELEDEDGNPVTVKAGALAGALRAGRRPLPLVVLSSCAGAGRGTEGLAATLLRLGADRVLAMQTAVTDGYATALAGRFYRSLAGEVGVTPAGALADARRGLETDRVEASRRGGADGRMRPEYGIATLLSVGEDPPLLDPAVPTVLLSRATTAPTGGSVRSLRIGELIGRRAELRTTVAVLRLGERAGVKLTGVMLTGIGGIGKTAIAGRVLSRLADEGWLTAVHGGAWNPQRLIGEVAQAIAGRPELASVHAELVDRRVEDTAKVEAVGRLLAQARLLVVFDDFEQNLTPGGERFLDPGFAEVFDGLCAAGCAGRLLVTCRYPVPDADSYLLPVGVPALSPAELGRLLLRLGSLAGVSAADRRLLAATIGGHPRLIEFVDALLRDGARGRLPEVTRRLRTLASEQHVDLTASRDLHQAVADVVLLGARDILLTALVGLLDGEQEELLLQAAVSTLPLTVEDLARCRWESDPTDARRAVVRRASARLVDLTLLAADGGQQVVHPWVAAALESHQGDGFTGRHRRAEAMRLHRLQTGRGGFDDFVEIARHQAATGRHEELVGFAGAVADLLARQLGELSVTAFLGQVLPFLPPAIPGYLPLADREIAALVNIGKISAARARTHTLLAFARSRAEADP
ncbi:CHAT domain-containing protein, partial [Frankia sp. Cr1]|uniref:CHAT domain-containing protein n=1 Tax=Frankia sp. Cr1 TaxID=3073931 RepID=UPI002AD5789E